MQFELLFRFTIDVIKFMVTLGIHISLLLITQPKRIAVITSVSTGCYSNASLNYTEGERAPGTHCIGIRVGPRTGLVAVEKRNILPLPGIQHRLSSLLPVETPRTQE
jgi:hypothetical protein